MTLTQLDHVLSAHTEGSFSAAARKCGLTQAALSNSVAKLEEELGDRIFSRTTRRTALTPFGLRLLPHIEQILGGRDALVASATERQVVTTVLGHSPLLPSAVLTDLVGAIRSAGFGTEIRLIEENLSGLVGRLAEHTLDLALMPAGTYDPSLRSVPVFEEPLYFVPRHSRPTTGPVVLTDLGTELLVMVPDQCGLAATTRALFAAASVPLATYSGEALGYHVLEEWAALDLGSAILPESRLAPRSRAVPLLLTTNVPATLTYRMVWHRRYQRGTELAKSLRAWRGRAGRPDTAG
jgi:DNA-binding transcriptional LysR family regulator